VKGKPKGGFHNGRYRIYRPSVREIATARDFNAPLGAKDNGETARPSTGFHAIDRASIERGKSIDQIDGERETVRQDRDEKDQ